ncbi:MAG: fused MFS/spermidine synthase, partial [Candidatus Riflebacteria bacterium]|nr:fused MFS/spermidine synthase [Candidatus Riflebacteria bacterium]
EPAAGEPSAVAWAAGHQEVGTAAGTVALASPLAAGNPSAGRPASPAEAAGGSATGAPGAMAVVADGPRAGDEPPGPPARVIPGLVFLFFFLSGFASLVCEIVWFKWFGLAIGNTTQSASVVVTVFFVGLGLGSLLSGRWADRWAHPLRAYGWFELALGGASLLTSLALAGWDSWIHLFGGWMGLEGSAPVVVKVGLAFALLLPPTVLMGSTLPILARFVVRHRGELGLQVGTLYSLNTLGAAAGCAFVGFWGIAWLGVTGSALLASALYVVIGGGALLAARRWPSPPVIPAEAPAGPAESRALFMVAVFAASGFISVSYEILWFRLLSFFTVNTVYVFAILLSVYLLGLVLGSAIAARQGQGDPGQALAGFARTQLLIAVAGVVALGLLGRFRTFLAWWGGDILSWSGIGAVAALVAIVLLPPCVLIGLTFPLASEITVTRLSSLGSRLGLVLAANTIVGAFGSLATGMVLIPALGSQGTAIVLAVANLGLFWCLLGRFGELRSRDLLRQGALTTVVVALMLGWLGPGWIRAAQTSYAASRILDVRETIDGTFLTLEYQEDGERYQQLLVNGTSYANNRPPGRHYMALLAHLPLLLQPAPRRAVVICIGTGTTVGAAAIVDRVTQVWAIDLSPEVFALAPHFSRWNHRFHEARHVRQVAADGRHFLLVATDTFDMVTFEPPPPLEAGVANLYSREFYRLVKRRLAPGGMVTQWIPFHQGFQDLQRSLIRAALDEFPHVSLWLADNQEGILLAGNEPLRLDPQAIAARLAEPDVAAELREVGISDVHDLLALLVLADDDLRRWVGDAPPVTDDRPIVERFLGYPNTAFDLEGVLARRTRLDTLLTGPLPDPARWRTAVAVFEGVWRATVADRRGDAAGAAGLLAASLALAPDNPYLAYRAAEYRRAVGP